MLKKVLAMTAAISAISASAALATPRESYTLTLTAQEMQVIVDGLGDLPLKRALPVWSKIQRQVEEQERQPADSRAPSTTAPPGPAGP